MTGAEGFAERVPSGKPALQPFNAKWKVASRIAGILSVGTMVVEAYAASAPEMISAWMATVFRHSMAVHPSPVPVATDVLVRNVSAITCRLAVMCNGQRIV